MDNSQLLKEEVLNTLKANENFQIAVNTIQAAMNCGQQMGLNIN